MGIMDIFRTFKSGAQVQLLFGTPNNPWDTEKIVMWFENSFHKEKSSHGGEPHQNLVLLLNEFRKITYREFGIPPTDLNDQGALMHDLVYTYHCACFKPPACARILAYKIIIDVINPSLIYLCENSMIKEEFVNFDDIVMHSSKKELEKKYRLYNPKSPLT